MSVQCSSCANQDYIFLTFSFSGVLCSRGQFECLQGPSNGLHILGQLPFSLNSSKVICSMEISSQSINQLNNQSIGQSISQSISQPVNQSFNQSNSQLINQSKIHYKRRYNQYSINQYSFIHNQNDIPHLVYSCVD